MGEPPANVSLSSFHNWKITNKSGPVHLSAGEKPPAIKDGENDLTKSHMHKLSAEIVFL